MQWLVYWIGETISKLLTYVISPCLSLAQQYSLWICHCDSYCHSSSSCCCSCNNFCGVSSDCFTSTEQKEKVSSYSNCCVSLSPVSNIYIVQTSHRRPLWKLYLKVKDSHHLKLVAYFGLLPVRYVIIHLNSVHKTLLPYHCRNTVIESESTMAITYSKVVQQLQQDLSKKNMLFSKDLIELSQVIGQGIVNI